MSAASIRAARPHRWVRGATCVVAAVLFVASGFGQGISSAPWDSGWSIDEGFIFHRSFAVHGGIGYAAGSFAEIHRPSKPCFVMDAATGLPVSPPGLTVVNVFASVPDGQGGWFICGSFTSVGGVGRTGVARLLPGGALDPAWNVNLTFAPSLSNFGVRSLKLSGSTLYVGGQFQTAGGQPRAGAVALDAATAAVLPWNPGIQGAGSSQPAVVFCLEVAAGRVYFGGIFSGVGGSPRNGAAAVDAVTGALDPWNPSPNGNLMAVVANGGVVYIGGGFGVRATDGITGAAAPWGSGFNNVVSRLAISGGTLYAGGAFGFIGGVARTRLAAFDTASGALLPWDPGLSATFPLSNDPSTVNALVVSGGIVYVGGNFASAGGQPRHGFAALDGVTAAATALDLSPVYGMNSLAISGSQILVNLIADSLGVAGIGTLSRKGLASFDLATGAPTSWAPVVNGQIYDIKVAGNSLYAVGDITAIDGVPRTDAAAFDLPAGTLNAWAPAVAGTNSVIVYGLTIGQNAAYLWGVFSSLNGVPRLNLGAVDLATGATLAWNPNSLFNTSAYGIEVDGDVTYVFGNFNSLGGAAHRNLARVDAVSGAALPFDAAIVGGGFVSSVTRAASTLYVSGDFTGAGGQTRTGLAEVSLSGLATPWNVAITNTTSQVFPGAAYRMLVVGPALVLGGTFQMVNGQPRPGAAEVDRLTGQPTPWNPIGASTIRRPELIEGGRIWTRGAPFGYDILLPPASAVPVGVGCGVVPAPALTSLPPKMGRTWAYNITGPPGTFGGLFTGQPAVPPIVFQGCDTYIDLNGLLLVTTFTMPPGGTYTGSVYIPPIYSAWGGTGRVGVALLPPQGLAVTNALDLTLGW